MRRVGEAVVTLIVSVNLIQSGAQHAGQTQLLLRRLLHEPEILPRQVLQPCPPRGQLSLIAPDEPLSLVLFEDPPHRVALHAAAAEAAHHWVNEHRLGYHEVSGRFEIWPLAFDGPEPVGIGPGLFDGLSDRFLQNLVESYLVPRLRGVRTRRELAQLALPRAVAEDLLASSSGNGSVEPEPVADYFANPDPREFHVLADADELGRMLAEPLKLWLGFLHPTQQSLATGRFEGPVLVTGPAGTGKTVVALHRARYLAGRGKSVMLATFSRALKENLEQMRDMLCSREEAERIEVTTVHSKALRMVQKTRGNARLLNDSEFGKRMENVAEALGCNIPLPQLKGEWQHFFRPRQDFSWEGYRGAPRTGRALPLKVTEKRDCWRVFQALLAEMESVAAYDQAGICVEALRTLSQEDRPDSVIVDEFQDLGPHELRLLAALGGLGPDGLFFVGDTAQSIYLKDHGAIHELNLGERVYDLRVNYRTTEEIKSFADTILERQNPKLQEATLHALSLLSGPEPELVEYSNQDKLALEVAARIHELLNVYSPEDVAVFARTLKNLAKVRTQLQARGIATCELNPEHAGGAGVRLGTMHRAKGLEFKVVFVINLSDQYLPHPKALAESDESDQETARAAELRLLYVAATRARDRLILCWSGNRSPFLEGLS